MKSDEDGLEERIEALGLRLRGSFSLAREELEALGWREDDATLILVGHTGNSLEPLFAGNQLDHDLPNPLDAWSHAVLTEIAEEYAGAALFPCDGPPYLPFQQWARRAEGLQHSPLGLLIHPEYGLWHGYRGALLLPGKWWLEKRPGLQPHPCTSCQQRPCLTACPVHAFQPHYDVPTCLRHLRTSAGAGCYTDGCLARRACPIGAMHGYGPAQTLFHMQKFAESDFYYDPKAEQMKSG